MSAPLCVTLTGRFLLENLIHALSDTALYCLIALGIVLIFGVVRLVNFAHGELFMLGGYGLLLVQHHSWPILFAAPVIVAIVAAIAMERVAFRPVRGADPTTMFITSFAVSFLIEKIVSMIAGSDPKSVALPPFFINSIKIGSAQIPELRVATLAIGGALFAGLALFLKRSRTGIEMRAAAADFEMARLLGVRANVVIATAFAISGVFAGFGAVMFVGETAIVTPSLGVQILLAGFVAAIVGGMYRLSGAIVGAAVVAFVSVGLQAFLPPNVQPFRDAMLYTVVIVTLLIRPDGIMRPQATERLW